MEYSITDGYAPSVTTVIMLINNKICVNLMFDDKKLPQTNAIQKDHFGIHVHMF